MTIFCIEMYIIFTIRRVCTANKAQGQIQNHECRFVRILNIYIYIYIFCDGWLGVAFLHAIFFENIKNY